MNKILIKDIKVGESDGGISCCGPIESSLVIAIKFKQNDKTSWIYNVDVGSIPNFLLSDKNIYSKLIKENLSEKEIEKYTINDFEGINFEGIDYEDITDQLDETEDNETLLIKLIMYLVDADWDGVNKAIKVLKGKYLEDFVDAKLDEK